MEDRKFVFSVGCGDAWLSYSSITSIAIATTREKAIELIAQHAENNEIELSVMLLFEESHGKTYLSGSDRIAGLAAASIRGRSQSFSRSNFVKKLTCSQR